MASNFSSLRDNRKDALAKINAEIQKEQQKGGGNDARFWKLTVDPKTKVGYAIIRFLPAPKNEELYWARIFNHAFKLNGQWLIENCPTTLDGRACPVCKNNNMLWNSGIDADKDVARDRKRKLKFISNILVVDDKAHPENNGKVFVYSYGKKIYEKIQELTNPQFPDAEPMNPFDFWEGANFKLKAQQKDGFQNYDKSEFDDPSAVGESDDDAIEAIWEQQHSLTQFVAEKEFKSFEDLEKRFTRVLTGDTGPRTASEAIAKANPTPATARQAAAQVDDDEPAPVKATPSTPVPAAPAKTRGRKPAPLPKPELEPEPDEDAEGEAADVPQSEEAIMNFFSGLK